MILCSANLNSPAPVADRTARLIETTHVSKVDCCADANRSRKPEGETRLFLKALYRNPAFRNHRQPESGRNQIEHRKPSSRKKERD